MQSLVRPRGWRFLAVAEVDLYIPILKYVFGEAQMGGPCAVVSTFRLRQEFYGLDQDDSLLRERLLKESIHELGHTLNLRHCQDYQCAMASSHSVEWIDLRDNRMCDACRYELDSNGASCSGTTLAHITNRTARSTLFAMIPRRLILACALVFITAIGGLL